MKEKIFSWLPFFLSVVLTEEILENVDNLSTNNDAYLSFLCEWEIRIDFFHKTNDRVIYGLQF